MYFVKKKDLKIVGGVSRHIVQFQIENYCEGKTIIVTEKQLKLN